MPDHRGLVRMAFFRWKEAEITASLPAAFCVNFEMQPAAIKMLPRDEHALFCTAILFFAQ